MTGYGRSYGAISVMNAIPCGIGSTIGIDLRTEAVFSESNETHIELIGREHLGTELVRTCVKNTLKYIGEDIEGYTVTVRTQIPPSVGLKSSSSVCNAVVSAVLNEFGKEMDTLEMTRLGVSCARECGVTITGAFDDACGCALGGLVITDNINDELIYRSEIPRYDVVLCIPEETIEKKNIPLDRYGSLRKEFESLVPDIKDDYLNVLTMNGRYVGELIDKKGNAFADIALKNGALAAGVSGTGPATAVIVGEGYGRSMAEKMQCRTVITVTR